VNIENDLRELSATFVELDFLLSKVESVTMHLPRSTFGTWVEAVRVLSSISDRLGTGI
jgi:hypothetical protein